MRSTRNQFFRNIPRLGAALFAVVLTLFSLVGCRTHTTQKASSISVWDAFAIISDTTALKQYVVLDVRGKMDYVRGHLGPAIWFAPDSLKDKINSLKKDKSVILYDSTGSASETVVDLLLKNGFTKVFVLKGGANEWVRSGFPVAVRLVENTSPRLDVTKKDITVQKVHEIVYRKDTSYAILDVRPYPSYKEGHIPGAVSIPYAPINEFVIKLTEQNYPKNKQLVVYCVGHTCNISDMAIDVMLRNGYTNVFLLGDGIEGWMSKAFAIEK